MMGMKSNLGNALITGANRGLGLETARQLGKLGYTVFLAGRNPAKAEAAADKLVAEKIKAKHIVLDVSDPTSIAWSKDFFDSQEAPLKILVNNAGIQLEAPGSWNNKDASVFKTNVETLKKTFETNTLGPLLLIQALAPLMIHHGYGRIVNVSSGMGQLTDMNGGWAAYRISKTSLNALTRIVAAELPGKKDIKINSVCPGWVRTDMGGSAASRSVEEGASGIVWAATLPSDGPSGGFFRDGKPIPW